jgi:CheY-like chemotaxis protein
MKELTKILMVEDESDIQVIARLALEAVGGFTVNVCSSGAEALASGPAFQPDLILLDVMMPELDGPGTLQALRRTPEMAGVPVVFMTAKVQPNEIANLRSLGALGVIAKPFDPLSLSSTIRNIWTEHHG